MASRAIRASPQANLIQIRIARKSYVDSTIQILKKTNLRPRGEKSLMKKCCLFDVVFCLFCFSTTKDFCLFLGVRV